MSRPTVTVMCSASLDGRLAPAAATSSRPFLAEVPQRFTDELICLRQTVDSVVVGNQTIRHDDSQLLPDSGDSHLRIVVDIEGRLTSDDTVLADDYPTAIAVVDSTILSYTEQVENHPEKELLSMGPEPDLGYLLETLSERGIRHVLLEGGGTLIYHFLTAELVDELRVLYLPVFVGDKDAVGLCDGSTSLFTDVGLDITRRELAGNYTLIEGKVIYNRSDTNQR